MGKVTTATAVTEMKKKKTKGRPSKDPIPLSPQQKIRNNCRSTRRNPNRSNSPPQPEFDDDEDERKEKKVKLVGRLPQSDDKSGVSEKYQHSRDSDSGPEPRSGSESDQEEEDRDEHAKKRKIDCGSDDEGLDQDKELVTETEAPTHGSPLDSGPATSLPDKKLLMFILDRLQKKDTYRVFSEPVDPDELPDYFDIIKQPMDFSTVRKKLDDRLYANLEELEADVCLICSNAMEYNGSDTVYFRQARSILELAKRDFKNLRSEGDDGAPQPKVVRRGRPPSNKSQKKLPEPSPVHHRVGTELSSGATLANGEDKTIGSNSYNLRKPTTLFRPCGSRNGENHPDSLVDWNNEFPASILRADMKHSKKQFTVDENKRDTYREFAQLSSGNNLSILYMKRLVPVGLQETLVYPRSLARYAANLGPVAWKLASKKIEAVLPAGVQYGAGWVGDNETPSQPSIDCSSNKLVTTPSVPDHPNSAVTEGLVKKQNEHEALCLRSQFPPQKNHPIRNGVAGMFLPGTQHPVKAETGSMSNVITEQAKSPESSRNARVEASNLNGEGEKGAFVKSPWSAQQRHGLTGPQDLNGSPQHPDLALQL